jgi:hypothetical protein
MYEQEQYPTGHSGHLHMGGAPPSREASVPVKYNFPLQLDRYDHYSYVRFPVPPPEVDLLEHLDQIAKQAGYKHLMAAMPYMHIPGRRLIGLRSDPMENPNLTLKPKLLLRNAIILGKISTMIYDPELTPVFTRRRLAREFELIRIPINKFYELD